MRGTARNTKVRRRLMPHVETITQRYLNGESLYTIGPDYNVDPRTIKRLLQQEQVPIRDNSQAARLRQGRKTPRSPRPPVKPMDALARIFDRCVQQGDCWVWTGATSPQGYGRLRYNGTAQPAHRVVYTIMVADIPDRLHIDHLCRTKPCLNPWHLEPVTPAVNNARSLPWRSYMHIKPKRCPKGHEFTPENTIARRNGRRMCRTCRHRYDKERRMRRRQP